MSEHMNGGLPPHTTTPVPPASSVVNGDAPILNGERSSPSKSVRWSGSDRDIIEIQKASIAIGLQPSSTALSASFAHSHNGDVNGVKFISLASPLNNDQRILSTASGLGRQDGPKNMVLQSLPMRATLHRHKQIPGRFFPSPSYTEFQRDVLESRPTPRRIIKKFKPNNHTNNSQLFPVGSPVKPRTASDKSTWIANHVYSRGSQVAGDIERAPLLPPSDMELTLNSARQYSIPATTRFHDGNNDTLITGSSKRLHAKDPQLEAPPTTSRSLSRPKQTA